MLILFTTGAGLQSYQSNMKKHSVAILFSINVSGPLVALETICFQPSTDALWHLRFIAPIQRATQAYCPVCYSVFFLLKVQCSFLHGTSPP